MLNIRNWFKSKPEEAETSKPQAQNKWHQALNRTGQSLFGNLLGKSPKTGIDEDLLDELEESLIRADVGVDTAIALVESVRQNRSQLQQPTDVLNFLKKEFTRILQSDPANQENQTLRFEADKLNVYIVVGVNGSGKTTFIGKLAHQFKNEGKNIIIGAGDTFRAAAEDQLAVWAQRAGVPMVTNAQGDASAVVFDTITQAKELQANTVIIDTAGRLQNKFNLMEELRKIRRILDKTLPEAHILETLLVIDATTGQNALKQAEVFHEAVQLTGVILTKLDGSAKGGIVLNIAKDYKLPIKMVGLGEAIEDLAPFDPESFIEGLFPKELLV